MKIFGKPFIIPLPSHLEKVKIEKSLKQNLEDKKLDIIKKSCPSRPFYLIPGWRHTTLPYHKIIKIFFHFVSMVEHVQSKQNDKFQTIFTIKKPDIPYFYDTEDGDINEQEFNCYLKNQKFTIIPGKKCDIRVCIFYDIDNDKYIIEPTRLSGNAIIFYEEIKKL